jgi:hypothetical protein
VHAPPLERRRVVAEDVEQERRLDRPGAERVHADPLPRELHRELAAEREHGPLRRGVGDLRGRGADDRDEGGDVDDRAAAPLEQVGDAVLAAEEDAPRVHGLDAVPRLDGGVEDRRVVVGRDAGVVVEDVDPAEALRRRAHHLLDLRLVGHVHGLRERGAVPTLAHRLLGRLAADVGDADLGALLREEDRRFAAHSAAGAGDHADLAVQTSHQPSVE